MQIEMQIKMQMKMQMRTERESESEREGGTKQKRSRVVNKQYNKVWYRIIVLEHYSAGWCVQGDGTD